MTVDALPPLRPHGGVPRIDAERLMLRLCRLGQVGRDPAGRLVRLALSDADAEGRALVTAWMTELGLSVSLDKVGNLFGTLAGSDPDAAPVMIGSHIDSVVDAGIYDGCLGVLAGLEVAAALREAGVTPRRPITIAAFTNEEGARFAPDMLGSLVFAGGLGADEALETVSVDGVRFGDELVRIGAAGAAAPGLPCPFAYLELHVEQGPILEAEDLAIGAVEGVQGISWQRFIISGAANHAGTTPMHLRRDAGLAAARIVAFAHDLARRSNGSLVATAGSIEVSPNVINVIPGEARLTIDLRDAREERLREAEAALARFVEEVAAEQGVAISAERLARFEPVVFDAGLVAMIERAAHARGLLCRRMISGAGHDAQMIARMAPAAMIFVPSAGGISHNPREFTAPEDVENGAAILLEAAMELAAQK